MYFCCVNSSHHPAHPVPYTTYTLYPILHPVLLLHHIFYIRYLRHAYLLDILLQNNLLGTYNLYVKPQETNTIYFSNQSVVSHIFFLTQFPSQSQPRPSCLLTVPGSRGGRWQYQSSPLKVSPGNVTKFRKLGGKLSLTEKMYITQK